MKLLKIAERVLRFSVNQYLGLKTINLLPKNKRSMSDSARKRNEAIERVLVKIRSGPVQNDIIINRHRRLRRSTGSPTAGQHPFLPNLYLLLHYLIFGLERFSSGGEAAAKRIPTNIGKGKSFSRGERISRTT